MRLAHGLQGRGGMQHDFNLCEGFGTLKGVGAAFHTKRSRY